MKTRALNFSEKFRVMTNGRCLRLSRFEKKDMEKLITILGCTSHQLNTNRSRYRVSPFLIYLAVRWVQNRKNLSYNYTLNNWATCPLLWSSDGTWTKLCFLVTPLHLVVSHRNTGISDSNRKSCGYLSKEGLRQAKWTLIVASGPVSFHFFVKPLNSHSWCWSIFIFLASIYCEF